MSSIDGAAQVDGRDALGVFVVRAWFHGGTLVARVVHTSELGVVPPVDVVLVTPRRLHREMSAWLGELGAHRTDPD